MEVSGKISDRVLSIDRSPLYAIMDLAAGMQNVLHLNIGEPDFKTPQHIIESAKRALDLGFTHYAPISGDPRLKELIAQDIKNETGIDYDPQKEILITAGGQAGLYIAISALVNTGDKVLVFSPYYPPYLVDIKLAGGIPVFVPVREERGFMPDPEEFESKITDGTKLAIIHSPNNPTGAVYDWECLSSLAKVAERHELLLLSDEVYWKFTYDNFRHYSIASLPNMKERTIVVNSLSKTYAMTGWRVGYVAGSEELIVQMLKIHHSINICANAAAQQAAIAALSGPQDCVLEFVKEYEQRRAIVKALDEIQGFECIIPNGAFYAFPNIKALGISSMELAKRLVLEAKVITVPGAGFGTEGEGYLRISYAQPVAVLEEAVDRIRKTLENLGSTSRS